MESRNTTKEREGEKGKGVRWDVVDVDLLWMRSRSGREKKLL